jgi:ATP adenylyltransferase
MDNLWAPWRNRYVSHKIRQGCIFCRCPRHPDSRQVYVLQKTHYSFSMLNIFPYNNGHVMVAPRRHVRRLAALKPSERNDLITLLITTVSRLDKILKPHGYNIGINIGRVAGAGFKDHLHIHIVPRWEGDTNFMPVISNCKVIPEALDSLYAKLANAKAKRTAKL